MWQTALRQRKNVGNKMGKGNAFCGSSINHVQLWGYYDVN